jgi:signal transduction histidine kinase
MGLGLFISKSIIERHGERIWAINNAAINGYGKRSTFAFSLSLSNLYKIIVLFRRRKITILF